MLRKALLCSARSYRRALSPYKWRCHCRLYPTCSQYALEAIERYGTWKGGRLAPLRALHCDPFSKDGYGPVP